ncbi:hypothetical protein ACTFQN_06065 [Bacillus cereus group sp. MYBK30-1]|uniref:hypothetical protein n=1 Tax=unclassified Bacillus cereus group TaxID=2750818 RepID=UPI003F7A94D1
MSYCNGDNCGYRNFHDGEKRYYFEQEEGSLYCLKCASEIESKYPGYIAKSDDDISNFEDEDEDED